MTNKNTTSNVVCAIASFIIPGLGQLAQGRIGVGVIHFVLAIFLWFVFLGWIINLVSCLEAAKYEGEED